MSLASHRPLSCPPPPPLLRPPPPLFPPWQPCTALLTQAATADAAAGKAARKRFAPPFSFSFLLLSFSLSRPHLFVSARREELFQRAASNLSRDCFVPFLPSVHSLSAIPSIVVRGSARVSRRRLHGYIYIYMYISVRRLIFFFFFTLFRFFFWNGSFGIWEGWFHRDARRLIELLPLSRTFSTDRCVARSTIGSRDLVQNFSSLFFLFFCKIVSRYRFDKERRELILFREGARSQLSV